MTRNINKPENTRPLVIPVFITGKGCPQQCVFCCGRVTAGPAEDISPESLRDRILKYQGGRGGVAQLAFYGGNFTGLPTAEQQRILTAAGQLMKEGLISSLRVSTRPDYVTEENTRFLKAMRVSTVELGAESMIDGVLAVSQRGHSASDVEEAVEILKSYGMETGIHLMAGLPGDSRPGFAETVKRVITLRPDMVRIHPTIVFEGTRLADLYRNGGYRPLGLDEAVDCCRDALIRFTLTGIPVIRMGLQATSEMEGKILAGPFHPSFGMLVESSIFLEMAGGLLAGLAVNGSSDVTMICAPSDESALRGLKNSNFKALRDSARPAQLVIRTDPSSPAGMLKAVVGTRVCRTCITDFYGGVSICSNQGL